MSSTPCLLFAVKELILAAEHPKGLHPRRLQPDQQGFKCLAVKNTLAYCSAEYFSK